MIKMVFPLRRREGMSREEFQRYWRGQHAPLVERHAEALHIRRYVQVHARDTDLDDAIAGPRGSAPRYYDGVAELWWDSLDDLLAAFTSEAGQIAGQELAALDLRQRFVEGLCDGRLKNAFLHAGSQIAEDDFGQIRRLATGLASGEQTEQDCALLFDDAGCRELIECVG